VNAPPNLNPQVKDTKMKSKTFKVGRSASTGRFTTVKVATQRKSVSGGSNPLICGIPDA
jgi:hypothetical protein